MNEESTPDVSAESTTTVDADALNAQLIGTEEPDAEETPTSDSPNGEHQETSDHAADAQTSEVSEEAETTESSEQVDVASEERPPVDTSIKAKKLADRKITQLGQELSEIKRQREAEEQRFIRRDASRIMNDPYEYGRMLKLATTPEDRAYIQRVFDALPGPHKNAAKAQEQAYLAEMRANESPEERDERIARELEERIQRKVEERYAPFVERQMQQARAENEKVLADFRTKHAISDDEFSTLEQKMIPFYKAAREAFPDLDDQQLLERALVAVDPERVKKAGRNEALIAESDRRARSMVASGTNGAARASTSKETDEERYVREKFDSAWQTRMKHYEK